MGIAGSVDLATVAESDEAAFYLVVYTAILSNTTDLYGDYRSEGNADLT